MLRDQWACPSRYTVCEYLPAEVMLFPIVGTLSLTLVLNQPPQPVFLHFFSASPRAPAEATTFSPMGTFTPTLDLPPTNKPPVRLPLRLLVDPLCVPSLIVLRPLAGPPARLYSATFQLSISQPVKAQTPHGIHTCAVGSAVSVNLCRATTPPVRVTTPNSSSNPTTTFQQFP